MHLISIIDQRKKTPFAQRPISALTLILSVELQCYVCVRVAHVALVVVYAAAKRELRHIHTTPLIPHAIRPR